MRPLTVKSPVTLTITTVARFDSTLFISYILSLLLHLHAAHSTPSLFPYAIQFIIKPCWQPLCHTSTMSKQLQLMENKIQSVKRLCNPLKQQQTIRLSLAQNSRVEGYACLIVLYYDGWRDTVTMGCSVLIFVCLVAVRELFEFFVKTYNRFVHVLYTYLHVYACRA